MYFVSSDSIVQQDKELKTLRNLRWDRAFSSKMTDDEDMVNRKATIVIEHLVGLALVSIIQRNLIALLLRFKLPTLLILCSIGTVSICVVDVVVFACFSLSTAPYSQFDLSIWQFIAKYVPNQVYYGLPSNSILACSGTSDSLWSVIKRIKMAGQTKIRPLVGTKGKLDSLTS